MIKNLIFDFGDVFINLDKTAPQKILKNFGNIESLDSIHYLFNEFEIGAITTEVFINGIQKLFPNASFDQILSAWNAMLLDFPKYRLDFIEKLAEEKKYKLFLLSNTNDAHIQWIQGNIACYEEFKSCFDTFYLSYEINLRKPNDDIYEYVLDQNKLKATETLFIDDTKINTDAASGLGIHIWNLQPGNDDVIELFSTKSNLF